MKKEHLKYLVCPKCKGQLNLQDVSEEKESRIKEGKIICANCNIEFPVLNYVPRFVKIENYAKSFGYQWLKHSKTQYDSYCGGTNSEDRVFGCSKWSRELSGEIILEAGSGAGRFTEQIVKTNAMIISFDYSYSVEANYENNGHNENLLIIQADIYNMPFKENFFNKVICIGVLQHTPDVKKSFMELVKVTQKGGNLVVDTYLRHHGLIKKINAKYFFRLFSKNIPEEKLYKFCIWYVDFMRPISKFLNHIPKGWWIKCYLLMIVEYSPPGFNFNSEENYRDWAICDTFDKLAPAYDFPQFVETVDSWFKEANFSEYEVFKGYNGVTGRGIK